ncbi:MAG: T9SS type A sorting domain-containing protein [Dysgonamonadaceae bacterium]|jgi:hypothetical protein|nr:T9SS type A sorting domain-containing protein [Dysgonamonadaceae bacterium]
MKHSCLTNTQEYVSGNSFTRLSFILLFFFAYLSLFAENITVPSGKTSVESYTGAQVSVEDAADLHITSDVAPLTNSTVTLQTGNSWLFFDNIRPGVVISNYLSSIKIGSSQAAAVNNTNCRVEVYINGTVVIPHANSISPLTVFEGQNFAGNAQQYDVNYHKTLGTMDNKIRSFKLKRGYMATLATMNTGLGYSRVFIADDNDLEITVLQPELDQTVSFIRVTKWYYPSKKGWCSSGAGWANEIDLTASTWYYSWSADKDTKPNQEYVPIMQKTGWPSSSALQTKTNVNHILGLNEPDKSDQANATVAQAIAKMPDLLKTGLRIGSPAIADNTTWLYNFIDQCDANNYRVDFVAIHAYWGGSGGARNVYTNGNMDIQKWYNGLKTIYDRVKRPLWITEWNNGANWTSGEGWSSADTIAQQAKQLADLQKIIYMMDTCSFVERYSIYNWVEDKRALVKGTNSSGEQTAGGTTNQYLTPAGVFYRDNKSVMAFNRSQEVVPALSLPDPSISSFSLTSNNTLLKINIETSDYSEIYASYRVEKRTIENTWLQLDTVISNQPAVNNFSIPVDISQSGQYTYRIRAVNRAGGISNPSNEITFAVTPNKDIQTDKLSLKTSDFVNVYFGKPYEEKPVTILGAPTNNNSGVLMSNRVGTASTGKLQLRFYPWSYVTGSIYTNDEMAYLFLPEGNYAFGDIKAVASKATAINGAWKTVTFPEGYFTATPIIIPTQASNTSASATSVHLRNVTKDGFEICLRRENAKTYTIPNETVHYLALSEGSGTMQGRKIYTGFIDNVGHTTSAAVTFNYGETVKNPLIFTHKQTANNDTLASNLRIISYTDTSAKIMNQIERSGNNSSFAVLSSETDKAGWLVIGEENETSGLEQRYVQRLLRVYPNPVSGILYFDNSTNEKITVKIINLQGITVKQKTGKIHRINVSDLPVGIYFVSINGKTQVIVKKQTV